MLPPRHRIRRGADFGQAIRSGSRGGSTHLVVHLRLRGQVSPPTDGLAHGPTPAEPARVGFVVSRAVGNAVVRNRVRRRLRALAAQTLPELPGSSMTVVRVLPPAASASYDELAASFGRALTTARRREQYRTSASGPS